MDRSSAVVSAIVRRNSFSGFFDAADVNAERHTTYVRPKTFVGYVNGNNRFIAAASLFSVRRVACVFDRVFIAVSRSTFKITIVEHTSFCSFPHTMTMIAYGFSECCDFRSAWKYQKCARNSIHSIHHRLHFEHISCTTFFALFPYNLVSVACFTRTA